MKKILSLLLTCVLAFSFVACEPLTPRPVDTVIYDNCTELLLNESMCVLSGFQTDELASFLEESFPTYIAGTSYTDTELTIYYIPDKLDDFKSAMFKNEDDAIEEFCSNNEKYKLSYNDSLNTFDIYITIGIDSSLFANTIHKAEFYSLLYQLISGIEYDGLVFNVNVYNSDTEKLVKSFSYTDNVNIKSSDWEGSYSEDCFFLTFNEDFMPSFGMEKETFIKYLSFYSDYITTVDSYLDSDSVVLVLNDKEGFLEAVKKNLSYKDEDIKALGENYSLNLSSDLKTMDVYYDEKVSDQDIARLVTTAILETKLINIIENESFTTWTLDYSIYNSNTKELAKTVHLPDESISLMGQDNW